MGGFQIDGILLVTGGGSGIGREIALAFAEEGARGIQLCDINQGGLEAVCAELRQRAANPSFEAAYTIVNVTKPEDCAKVVQDAVGKWGRIDYAVNCAGITKPRTLIGDYALADYNAVIDVNLSGVFYCMQAELMQLMKQDGRPCSAREAVPASRGCIVNVGSICGMVGQAELGPYVASKHGVLGLTKTAAAEYGGKQIRINAVSPGYILTPLIKTQKQLDALNNIAEQKVPAGRPGYAEEIAAAVLFVCSPRASFINGANVPVDGGLTARA